MKQTSLFASDLPGRIRLRHPMLRNRDAHARFHDRLRELAEVESNPAAGSLLLRFDPADAGLNARIRAEIAALFGEAAPSSAPPSAAPERRSNAPVLNARAKWEINRVAKIGAIAAMAFSIAALRSSRKLHAQAGALSVFLMLVHVAIHWRRAFR
ncbi:hypothetical protein M2322_003629 [Rhodoblastus acidophilus]|uniref:hypothetical protein n=1 Tax=Rhodoblastus acidophilus TaxID=1074 RepID=UPI0022253662|nr:hypothetical protein [Rhodoblastus acidophilus]MCW2318062.1 hypothetical protein [Rhodoblastus acidophilus]